MFTGVFSLSCFFHTIQNLNLPKSLPVELKRGNTMVKIYLVQNGDYAEFRVVYYNTTGERQRQLLPNGSNRRLPDCHNSE